MEHDITQGLKDIIIFDPNDVAIFVMPVYAGRMPQLAAQILGTIEGKGIRAIGVCVYGNRDYDDALLELKDITELQGFEMVAAAAFIARHSIFPEVAASRPDESDRQQIESFGEQCVDILKQKDGAGNMKLNIKGKVPYKTPGKIPFVPTANRKCDACGACVKLCPVGAIPESNPKKTDKNLCFACTRCITVCPKDARRFRGLLFYLVNRKFVSKYSERREPEIFKGI